MPTKTGKVAVLKDRVGYAMEQHRWNQSELARKAQVPQGTISRIVGGEMPNPRVSIVIRLARALSVSLDWLCGLT